MTPSLLLKDVLLWSVQIALLVAAAAVLPTLLGMKAPKIRLVFRQAVLAACLLLPAIRPWKQDVVSGAVTVSTTVISAVASPAGRSHFVFPTALVLLILLSAGVVIRLGLLVSGLVRLRRYRRGSQPLIPPSPWGVEADLRICRGINSPVTFGFRKPVVLLPTGFSSFSKTMRDAILCHEILHVRRHDWLFTVGEETVRALLWFHPAIWWLLREIQLVREEAVDREVVEMTKSRDPYIDALLAIAGAAHSDLAPAPLFLRKRQLKQRVASILKEVHMSTARSIFALGASVAILAAFCWMITGALPLHAAPQDATDPAGVSVDLRGAQLMHRQAVSYPREAMEKGIGGIVVADLKLDAQGDVTDASIASGPDELRKAVLQSVLNWHFMPDPSVSTREISVAFDPPAAAARVTKEPTASATTPLAVSPQVDGMVATILIRGLSDAARDQLLTQLPVHTGDTLTAGTYMQLIDTVHAFDSHLGTSLRRVSPTQGIVEIFPLSAPPPPPPPPAVTAAPPGAIRVGDSVMAANLVTQTRPVYPPLAKAAGVQGTVQFQATIAKDGTVQNLQLLSGPPLLVKAAMDAVQTWVYRPTMVNGNPVAVVTTIDVNFTLAE